MSPDRPMGIGLRLSGAAARSLEHPAAFADLADLLDAHGLYVFTINGFPYGRFHGAPVKEGVYRPDWTEPERLDYSDRLARILAQLLPEGEQGTVSTVPLGHAPLLRMAGALDRAVDQLLQHAAALVSLRDTTGRSVTLAIEPEPCCAIETTTGAVDFFERHLFSRSALARFGALAGIEGGIAEEALRRHVGICLDTCHAAVEFESPSEVVDVLRGAGIAVAKVQLSAGLGAQFRPGPSSPHDPGGVPGGDPGGNTWNAEMLAQLRSFDDGVYLHQVVERRGATLTRFADLTDAMASLLSSGRGEVAGATGPAVEWRVHCHVPIFAAALGRLTSTQPQVRELLERVRREAVTTQLEVETYTWSVLPREYRDEDVTISIARELAWVLSQLG